MKQWQVPPHEVFPLISSRQSSRDAPMPSPHPVSKGPGPGASKMTLWDSEVSEPAPNPSQRALCVLPGGPVPLPKLGLHLMILLELGGCPWRSRPHPRNNLPPRNCLMSLYPVHRKHLFTQHLISFPTSNFCQVLISSEKAGPPVAQV